MDKKILVVDDEEVVRKVLRIHLTRLGYEIKEAADGVQALEELKNDNFDLVICDIMMPIKDGWQVLREIKSNPKFAHIPVIVLTAKNECADMRKGYKLDADYYITKPFSKLQLICEVKLILGEISAETVDAYIEN